MRMSAALAITSVALTTQAFAGVVGTTGNVGLFGRSYSATRWDLAGDLGLNNAGTANRGLVVEGLAVYNGVLYLHGDDDANQFEPDANGNGRMLSYQTGSTGSFANSGRSQFSVSPSIGSEGIAINPSGAGYGSFSGSSPNVISIEGSGGSTTGIGGLRRAVTDVATGISTQTASTFEGDDIAFLPSTGGFAVLQKRDNPSSPRGVQFYDASFNPIANSYFQTENNNLGGGFILPRGGRGMAAITSGLASALAGTALAAGDYLLIPNDRIVSGDAANSRRLGLFSLSGQLIASTLLTLPSAIGDVQAITVDETIGLLFVGDQSNQRVWTVALPTPGAAGLLALGGLVAARRRRA